MYVVNRIPEINRNANISEWLWLLTENNVADFITCTLGPSEIYYNSNWQNGSVFLYQTYYKCPINIDPSLPDLIKRVNITNTQARASFGISNFIDINK